MYKQSYKDLWVTRLDADNKARLNCRYTYLVSANVATRHTAFHSFEALQLWTSERGLTLPAMPNDESWFSGPIVGSYATVAHMDEATFYATDGALIRVLCNAQYTLGIVAIEPDGTRTVHSLNPNVKTRPVFEYRPEYTPVTPPMIAHYWDADGLNHTQLRVTVEDLQELIYRCGWTIIHTIDNLTPAAQCEIDRLAQLPYVEGNNSGREWWAARVVTI